MALQNNLELRVDEFTPAIAAEAIREASGEFDPVFSVEVLRDDLERRQNTMEFLSTGEVSTERIFEEESLSARAGVAQKTALGTVIDLHTRMRRVENTVSRESPASLFSPEYDTFAGLQITQPILRGFGPMANLVNVRAARVGLTMAESEREIMVVNKISEVVDAYYDMVFGQENRRVKEEALRVAEQFLHENQRRLELGRMAPIDVAEARVRVSQSREELITARDFLRERELRLRRLIYDHVGWTDAARLRAVAELPDSVEPPGEPYELFGQALERRPDYRLAQAESTRNRLRENYSRNRMLPQLDLQITVGYSGLDRDLERSYHRIRKTDHPQWSTGVVFSIPWGNREGRAQRAAARMQKRQSEAQLLKIEHDIAIALQNSVARLEAINQRLETARESLQLAEEAARIETIRLDAGQTTTFRVLELQSAVSDAQTRELAARVDARKALAEIWAVSGKLLEEHGFYLESDAASQAAARSRRSTDHGGPSHSGGDSDNS